MSGALVVNEIYLSLQGESTFAGLPCVFIRLTACDLRCSYCDTAYAFTEGKKLPLEKILAKVARLAEPFQKCSASLTPGFSPVTAGANGETVSTVSGLRKTAEAVQSNSPAPATGLKSGVNEIKLPIVELTGGEPLLQKNSLPLMQSLCDEGFTVLLETGGAHDISPVDTRVHRIMDLKCPSSGEAERNRWDNLNHLKASDEIKFVIGTVEDYEWAKQKISEHRLDLACPLLFSWVQPLAPEQQNPSLKKVPAGQTPVSRRELAKRIIADALPVRFQAQLHKIIWPPEQRGV